MSVSESMSAEDMPIEVQRLLKSYDLSQLLWAVPQDRHAIVVAILTRGDEAAERWLWEQCSRESVRALLRKYHGAGCDNEGRAILREKLGLTEDELPPRPFASVPWRG
jgi:hypothetical protein